jgi:hypothetical protein
MVQDQRLKIAFVRLIVEHNQTTSRQDTEIQIAKVNEAKIDLRVYGETQDIYVDPYKNQQMIDLEKQKIDGDFSDLFLNSYIAVPSNTKARKSFELQRWKML